MSAVAPYALVAFTSTNESGDRTEGADGEEVNSHKAMELDAGDAEEGNDGNDDDEEEEEEEEEEAAAAAAAV